MMLPSSILSCLVAFHVSNPLQAAGRFPQLCVCIKWHVFCIQAAPTADVTAIYYSDIASVTPSEIYNTPVLLFQMPLLKFMYAQ